ncbi:hypothetical protein BGX28_010133 [Mortierella sp. GBA30]|nr:hypothetical protein BGX28_010133 [Mortierella sp. GBA30]
MVGHIFCHDCSSRSIALPQLGYTKAVRVCNDCFEVAYLVAYCLSDDLGPSTQIHGARGLYELVETNDAKTLDSILEHGGLDAMVYLCSVVHGYELHAWATKSLAALADNQAFQNTIVAKRAMPKLFHLVSAYAYHITSPLRPPSPPMPLTRMASTASLHTKGIRRIETIATVMMNITHIVFQMVADRLLASQLVMEGAVDGLMCLSVYFPAGVRTRAMEHAIRSVSIARDDVADDGADTPLSGSQRNSEDGRSQRPASQQTQGEDDEDETGLVSMDDIFHVQLEHMQGQAAKCLSVLAADVSNQAFIVDDPERIDRLVQLLYSNNPDVVKYASKTMAYLSLRNDRYKPDIVKGTGAAALLTVIRTGSENHALSEGNSLSEAVSHACCALANLATNTESQEILMSHLDLLHTTCTVVGQFPHQREIERHVARLIANLALYDQNKLSLLTAYSSPSDTILDPSQSLTHQHQQHPAVPHRYSSPPPPARRAKGNVIPTLLYIGALTLERAGAVGNSDDEQSYPHHGQDVIDFMNDDRLAARTDPGYLTPNDSLTEEDVSAQDLDYGEHARSVNEEAIAEWATVPGMEDVQRHIIRAIDNLITSVMDDPASNQSFKVFSRIWPTLGLIKTIQMTNQDEDTQRRASHVLSTLVHQQQIHADTIVALKQQSTLSEDISQPAPVVAEYLKQEGESAESKLKEDEELEQQRQVAEEAEKAKTLEQAQLEKEKLVKDQIEKKQKEKSERKAAKERLEKEQAEERSRQEAERLEKERTEQERVEQECIEQERIEQERAEQERLEQKRLEQEHLEQERLEKERHEEERVEKERIEKERIEKERIEKERIEKERVEQERIEKKLVEQTRIEKERVEQERIEKERVEQERIEKERVEQARIEQKRLKKETLEREQKEREREDRRASERRKVEDEHDEDSAFESLKAENKGGSSSEDQTTSFDDEPKPKEKGKKKKKKHAK